MAVINRRNGLRLGAAGNLGLLPPGETLIQPNPNQYATPLGGPPQSIYGQRPQMGYLDTLRLGQMYQGMADVNTANFVNGYPERRAAGLAEAQAIRGAAENPYYKASRETQFYGQVPQAPSLGGMQARYDEQQAMANAYARNGGQPVDARFAVAPSGSLVAGGQYVRPDQGAYDPVAGYRQGMAPTPTQEAAFPARGVPQRGTAIGTAGIYQGQNVAPGAGLAMMPTGSPGNMMPSRAEMATRRQERSAQRAEVQAQETAMRQQNHLRSLYGAGRAPLPVGAGFGSAAPAPVNGTPGTGMVPVEEAQAAMKRSGLSDEEIRKRLLGLGYSEQQVGAPSLRWDPMPNVRWQPPQTYQVGPFGR